MPFWKKQDPITPSRPSPAAGALDLSKYDLDGFRSDVGAIVDLPGAAGTVAKRTALITVVAGFVIFLIYQGRMGGIALFFFMLLVIVLTAMAAATVAVFFILRKRVDQTVQASSRVVHMVEMMHGDYQQVQQGVSELSIRDVGAEVAEELVFPALFGAAGQASALAGPMGFILRPALRIPMKWVQETVVSALDELPDESDATSEPVDGMTDEARTDIAVAELADSTASVASGLSAEYEQIQSRIEGIVGRLGAVALGPVRALVFTSLLPLLFVLLVAWWIT